MKIITDPQKTVAPWADPAKPRHERRSAWVDKMLTHFAPPSTATNVPTGYRDLGRHARFSFATGLVAEWAWEDIDPSHAASEAVAAGALVTQ
jgi:hypothetical protein